MKQSNDRYGRTWSRLRKSGERGLSETEDDSERGVSKMASLSDEMSETPDGKPDKIMKKNPKVQATEEEAEKSLSRGGRGRLTLLAQVTRALWDRGGRTGRAMTPRATLTRILLH